MPDFKKYLPYGLLIALLAFAYYPTFLWMIDRWSARDSYYTHGFVIPLVALYWVFKKRKDLQAGENTTPIHWGTAFLLAGITLQIMGSILRIYFVSAISMVILLLGAVYTLFGKKVFTKTWFPVTFLLTMVPLPLLAISQITFKMKVLVSNIAAFLINQSGIEAIREGSYIYTPNSLLLVGDPCSGLRSFLAFLCLGLIFGYMSKIAIWKRVLLVAAGFPLALLSNILRVYGLGMIGEIYGTEYTAGFIHDASGVLVFVLAFLCFMGMKAKLEAARG